MISFRSSLVTSLKRLLSFIVSGFQLCRSPKTASISQVCSGRFITAHGERVITEERPTAIADHIPDSTPLAEAFLLFDEREWYLTLRENYVSGLITYWEFNRHEFRVQLYTIVSLIEGISRDIL